MQLRQSGTYISLDPIGQEGLHIRVAVNLPTSVPTDEVRTLQALFRVSDRIGTLVEVPRIVSPAGAGSRLSASAC